MQLPAEVQSIITTLTRAGWEAFAVGGCVRDHVLRREPADWDVATNASPDKIQALFPKHFYNNRFGTVTVLTQPSPKASAFAEASADKPAGKPTAFTPKNLRQIEVTTYRVDAAYSDQRHPDEVHFTRNLIEDLARRDFTINALALVPGTGNVEAAYQPHAAVVDDLTVIDPFGGLKDLHRHLIRAVGNPAERFAEDALRLLRAVRFAAQLDFTLEPATQEALAAAAPAIAKVSAERIRDELVKLVMSDRPEYGFNLLKQTGLLLQILPELAEGVGVGQNKHHIYTVFDHNIKSLQFAADYDYPLHVRFAALLHDIGKPRTKRPQGDDYTFYAHEIVGERMAEKLLKRLRFANDLVEQVTHLVRHHMFYYDVGKVTEAGARRLLRRVGGPEKFQDLIKLRIAERKGSGVPKAEPYRLRHLQFLVEKASQEPVSVGQLAINGADLIEALKLKPSPIIGGILNALLAEVLDDPAKNNREHLLQRARELQGKDPAELKQLGEAAKEEEERKQEDDIRRKYHV